MELTFDYHSKPLGASKADCAIVFVAEGKDIKGSHLDHLPSSLQNPIKSLFKQEEFTGKSGQSHTIYPESGKVSRLLVLGLGNAAKVDLETLRSAAGLAGKAIASLKTSKVALIAPTFIKKGLKSKLGIALAEGLVLGSYEFKTYKTSNAKKKNVDATVSVYDPEKWISEKSLSHGKARAEATNLARDLGNTPGNRMRPSDLEKQARALAKEYGLKLTVLDEEQMAKQGMHMFLGVGKGSVEPSKLIILEHQPKKASKTIAFVGKGITFDSGGISLKPGRGMDEMKFDMCGSAAVLGAMKAVGMLQPKQHVVGAIAAAENMPSGEAQKPGDIVKSLSGKTVEVLNTDAEGRLVLGDTLTYVEKHYKPDAMIDLATLTGACVTALGRFATGAVTNNEALQDAVVDAGKTSGDRVWPLPSFPQYEECLKGKYADLKNMGDGTAGTVTAGMFLKQFIKKTPWVHLDIAGTAWNVKGPGYIPNDGATGVGVRLLIDVLDHWK